MRGGLTFAGVNGQPSGLYETPKNNVMPRIGLAYKLDDQTVLRGGYGMFYGFLGQRRGDVVQSGFSQNTSLVPSLDNGLTFIDDAVEPFPTAFRSRSEARSASRRSSDRASRSSTPIRGRRGRSGGRSASSASCPGAGSPRRATLAITAPNADVAQHERDAQSVS